MFCPYCGKNIADDSSFCAHCGNDVRMKNFDKSIDTVGNIKEIKKDDISKIPVKPVKVKRRKLLILIPMVILIVICIAAGGILLGKGFFDVKNTDYCVWASDDSYNLIRDITKNSPESIPFSSLSANGVELYYDLDTELDYAQFSSDGRYLYYLNKFTENDTGTLCYVDLSKIKKETDADKYITQIDSDVYTDINTDCFHVFEDGTVCYIKYNYSDEICQLYYYDRKKSELLSENVDDIKYFDKEILFSELQEDDNASIYFKDLNSEENPKKIIADAHSWDASDTDHILYDKNINDENNTGSLYITGKNTDTIKVADDVNDFSQDVILKNDSGDTAVVYYEVLNNQEINLGDVVTYDKYNDDSSLEEPNPDDSKYQESTYWGTDLSDSYYEAVDEYEQAQNRLENLIYLSLTDYNLKTYSLYSFDLNSGKSSKICDNASSENYISISGNAVGVAYYKEVSELKPIDISHYIEEADLETLTSEVSDAVNRACINRDKIYFTINSGSEQELDFSSYGNLIGDIGNVSFVLFDSGKKVALMEYSYDDNSNYMSSDIYVTDIKNDKIGSFSVLTLEECDWLYSMGDTLWAQANMDSYILINDEFVLFRENDELLNETFYSDGSILFLDNYQENYGGTLTLFDKNGTKSKIADDVTYFIQLENENILYISNENLKLYNGKETSTIGTGVKMFWVPNKKI